MERKIVKIGASYYVSVPKHLMKQILKGEKVVFKIELKRTKAILKEVKKVARERKRSRDLVFPLWGKNSSIRRAQKS